MKQKHTTDPKVNQLLKGHHNDGGQIQTKVFINNAGYGESKNNGSKCKKMGHWSVKTRVEADQCPQSQETVVLQKQSKNATQNVSDHKSYASVVRGVPHEGVTFDNTQALLFDINGIDEDKFVNIMFAKRLNRQLRRHAELNCDNYKKWKCQTSFDFGITPLGEFVSSDTSVQSKNVTDDPINLHRIIKNSGTYNYLGCRIPIKSQLKVDVLARELEGYWDTQLLDFLTYGFPLDFDRNSKLRCEGENQNAAL